MRYEILGSLRVSREGVDRTPVTPKEKKILALLLVEADKVVPLEKIVAELWGPHPPQRANATVYVYVSRLRKLLSGPDDVSPIVTASPGYVLRSAGSQLDVREFEELYQDGSRRYRQGDLAAASALFTKALGLWRGPVLHGIPQSIEAGWLAAVAGQKRLNAMRMRVECDLALGRHHEMIEELDGLVVQHPLHEPFYRQLMVALYRVGRQVDALAVYRNARHVIREQLGVEPDRSLQEVQQAILRGDLERSGAPSWAP